MLTLLCPEHAAGVNGCRSLIQLASDEGIGDFVLAHMPHMVDPASAVIRWGSLALLPPVALEVNSVEAVSLANNKTAARMQLDALAPQTYTFVRETQLPCLVRPQYHYGAHHFYVCRNHRQLMRAINRCGEGWYASEIVDKAKEYRIFVLHNRIVAVSERFPPDDRPRGRQRIAWNTRRGGHMHNARSTTWSDAALNVAIQGTQSLGLDWAVVDVVTNHNDEAFVLECNTAPGLSNTYTMARIARAFAWLDNQGMSDEPGQERWHLHPGVVKR
jgi:glutathione synthase/RimK-type ligase-like ATP-grasp enzyme